MLGDSTFMHSGITGLIDMVYNRGTSTVIILDNRTTAMTGHQGHPGTGVLANGAEGREVNLEALVKAIGVEDTNIISAFDIPAIESTLKRCIANNAPSVVIAQGPCALRVKRQGGPFAIDPNECIGCFDCLSIGCPSITVSGEVAEIDATMCVGSRCGVCAQVCPQEAISEMKQ